MTQISQLVSTDSRTSLNRLRRPQLQRILKRHGIAFDPRGPAAGPGGLRALIEANGIDFMRAEDWNQVAVKDERGNTSIELYPKEKEHSTAKKEIDYDGIIEKKAKDVMDAELQQENTDLKEQMKTMQTMLETLMAQSTNPDPAPYALAAGGKGKLISNIDYSTMKMGELRSAAKAQGIKVTVKTKKDELIEKLNG